MSPQEGSIGFARKVRRAAVEPARETLYFLIGDSLSGMIVPFWEKGYDCQQSSSTNQLEDNFPFVEDGLLGIIFDPSIDGAEKFVEKVVLAKGIPVVAFTPKDSEEFRQDHIGLAKSTLVKHLQMRALRAQEIYDAAIPFFEQAWAPQGSKKA